MHNEKPERLRCRLQSPHDDTEFKLYSSFERSSGKVLTTQHGLVEAGCRRSALLKVRTRSENLFDQCFSAVCHRSQNATNATKPQKSQILSFLCNFVFRSSFCSAATSLIVFTAPAQGHLVGMVEITDTISRNSLLFPVWWGNVASQPSICCNVVYRCVVCEDTVLHGSSLCSSVQLLSDGWDVITHLKTHRLSPFRS